MRRLRELRSSRTMARPTSAERRPMPLGTRIVIGWVVAIVVVVGVAFALGRIGGSEVPPIDPTPSEVAPGTPQPIAFGTQRDPDTGAVASGQAVDRFASGDRFVYTIEHEDSTGETLLYVEVVTADGSQTAVQTPAPLPFVPAGASVFGYDVPADALLADFGPGRFIMRIYTDPADEPIAVGTFELVGPSPSG